MNPQLGRIFRQKFPPRQGVVDPFRIEVLITALILRHLDAAGISDLELLHPPPKEILFFFGKRLLVQAESYEWPPGGHVGTSGNAGRWGSQASEFHHVFHCKPDTEHRTPGGLVVGALVPTLRNSRDEEISCYVATLGRGGAGRWFWFTGSLILKPIPCTDRQLLKKLVLIVIPEHRTRGHIPKIQNRFHFTF